MGAKGVLFSNVQPELEEYFVEGEEWIGFCSQEEMLDKAAFYLEHLELLEQIRNKGYEKVGKQYTYETALDSMFHILGRELM
jgi:spore maturation protein CgeB